MLRVVSALTLAVSALLAQAPAPGPLVRLYPVVTDGSGQPVTDLTADDFKIVDQNTPASILAFHGPSHQAAPKADVL